MIDPDDPEFIKAQNFLIKFMLFIIFSATLLILFIFLTGCTVTFQNISTHGNAQDLVDDTDTIDAEPNLTLTPGIP